MKFKLFLSVVLIALAASSAAAQEKTSLRSLPAGEAFSPPDASFSIALPRDGVKTGNETKNGGGEKQQITRYEWKLPEGAFSLAVIIDEKPMDNPMLIDMLMLTTARRYRDEGVEIISQQKLDMGKVHGGELVRRENGRKIIFRMFVKGAVTYTLTAVIDKKAPDAEKLMMNALESFKVKQDQTDEGHMFRDPEDRFSIALPSKPDEVKTNSEAGKDGSATQYK
jgi:hypothetical protein